MLTDDPAAVHDVLPILLSPTNEDLEDLEYWWALARAASYRSDLSAVVKIYLRFAPYRQSFLLAYFSSLALFFHRLRWKDAIAFYERFKNRPTFWYSFSQYLARRGDRRAYKIILQNLENPALRPYLWKAVSQCVFRNGYVPLSCSSSFPITQTIQTTGAF